MATSFLDWIRILSWSDPNVRGSVYAVVATLVLIIGLRLLAAFFRRLQKRYESRIEEKQAGLRVQQWEVFSTGGFQKSIRFVFRFLHILAVLLILDIYVTLVLRLFPASEPFSDRYFELVTFPIVALFRAIVGYIPDLLYIVVVSALTFFQPGVFKFVPEGNSRPYWAAVSKDATAALIFIPSNSTPTRDTEISALITIPLSRMRSITSKSDELLPLVAASPILCLLAFLDFSPPFN